MRNWERLRTQLCIGIDEPLVVYKRTWTERPVWKPWKSYTTKYVWEEGFDESHALTKIPEKWRASIWSAANQSLNQTDAG